MYQRVSFLDFIDAFRDAGREKQFSHEALDALFNYIEQYEEDTGEPVELDVVGLCCEFEESSVDDIIKGYGVDVSECKTDDDRREAVEDFLNEHTTVIWSNGDVILFQQF